MTSLRLRLLTVAALVSVAACKDERSITTEPVGDLGFGQNLLKQATNLPRGRVLFRGNSTLPSATPANDSIYIDLAGLDSLTGAQYTLWVANDSATKFTRLTGTLAITRVDTTINASGDPVFSQPITVTLPNVSSFSNGRPNYLMRFSTTRTTSGIAATDSTGIVLVSIETGTAGTTPSDRRILWSRRGATTVTADTFTVTTVTPNVLFRTNGFRFGNLGARPADDYVFATTTAARAFPAAFTNIPAVMPIIPRGRIEKRGSIFTVNDSNYYRPPIGYYYEAWAIRTDTLGRSIDTLTLGRKASPYPNRISFYDADRTIPDPQYMFGTPTPVIVASQHRVSADTVTGASPNGMPWREFTSVNVTLQNKAAPMDRMGGVVIMTVGTPGSISGR